MAGRLAIIAGRGRLPAHLRRAVPEALVAALEGASPEDLTPDLTFRIERLGALFKALKSQGITDVCFAGAIDRPALNPARLDAFTAARLPRLLSALKRGDDGALRVVLSLFEEQGLTIRGAHEVAPDLLPAAGIATRARPDDTARTDTDRALAVLGVLAPQDVGQGAVIAGGQVLALETLPGTDWMLDRLTEIGPRRPRAPGVFVKIPKAGQDLRIDMPLIGPDTVARCARAGLGGLVIAQGGVLVLDPAETLRACDAAGLFLWVCDV